MAETSTATDAPPPPPPPPPPPESTHTSAVEAADAQARSAHGSPERAAAADGKSAGRATDAESSTSALTAADAEAARAAQDRPAELADQPAPTDPTEPTEPTEPPELAEPSAADPPNSADPRESADQQEPADRAGQTKPTAQEQPNQPERHSVDEAGVRGDVGAEVGPGTWDSRIDRSADNSRGQMNDASCVAASCRMVHNSMTGGDLPEAEWRNSAQVSKDGGLLSDAASALASQGVDAKFIENAGMERLTEALDRGPAIVSGAGHAVVVDGINDAGVHVRDPQPAGMGSAYIVSRAEFEEWWGSSLEDGGGDQGARRNAVIIDG